MDTFTKVYFGLTILSKYEDELSIDYVPNSFPNGTPDHPSRCYLEVHISERSGFEVRSSDKDLLLRYGWGPEQDGEYWVFYY
jgi:hypothetical protein